MPHTISRLEDQFTAVLAGSDKPSDSLFAALDTLPAPIYVTDASGVVVHYNAACIDFAGRRPIVGQDRWCVTWKLYTEDGEPLPHEVCPMAEAIKTGRAVSGITAIAERPDGTRVRFIPHPVPLVGADGTLQGAVNMLIDITDGRQANALRVQAERCRRLARDVSDRTVTSALHALADEYELKASKLDRPI